MELREIKDPLERRRWLEGHPNSNGYYSNGEPHSTKWTTIELDDTENSFHVPKDEPKESDLRELLTDRVNVNLLDNRTNDLLTAIVDRIEKLESSK